MCLQTTQEKPLIAKRDIVCYKLVEKHKITGEYRSFYQYTFVVLNTLYTSELVLEDVDRGYKEINFGLHSFPLAVEAMRYTRKSSIMPGYTGEVIKCIIPAGSEYYIGTVDYSFDSYASNAIYYTDEIIYKF